MGRPWCPVCSSPQRVLIDDELQGGVHWHHVADTYAPEHNDDPHRYALVLCPPCLMNRTRLMLGRTNSLDVAAGWGAYVVVARPTLALSTLTVLLSRLTTKARSPTRSITTAMGFLPTATLRSSVPVFKSSTLTVPLPLFVTKTR